MLFQPISQSRRRRPAVNPSASEMFADQFWHTDGLLNQQVYISGNTRICWDLDENNSAMVSF